MLSVCHCEMFASIYHGERLFTFIYIACTFLTCFLRLTPDSLPVIIKLVRHSEILAEIAECGGFSFAFFREDRSSFGRRTDKSRRFPLGHGEIRLFCD